MVAPSSSVPSGSRAPLDQELLTELDQCGRNGNAEDKDQDFAEVRLVGLDCAIPVGHLSERHELPRDNEAVLHSEHTENAH